MIEDQRLTNLGELSADCTGLLWSEIKREVLLALVEFAQVLALLRVHNGQDAGNRLADTITIGQEIRSVMKIEKAICFGCGRDYENGQLAARTRTRILSACTYIRVSFDDELFVIFCTRRVRSSRLSSSSCLVKSAFDLQRRQVPSAFDLHMPS